MSTSKGPSRELHPFWDSQPVPKSYEDQSGLPEGPVDAPKTPSDVRSEPYPLPDGFEWHVIDVDNRQEVEEVYNLLNANYVEDDDNMFRFDYSRDFLVWALKPPGFLKDWHIAVRVTKTKKLYGFISAVPATVRAYQSKMTMVEINFLCVHKKLRAKRLAPVLIKEITRRVNKQDIWQAVYTAGSVLPTPVSSCRYYHRSLNPKKLIDVKFSYLGKNMTMARTIKLYRVPEQPSTPGIRPMTSKDVPSACKLLAKYLEKFSLALVFDEADFAHWLLPRDGVIYSYVATDSKGQVTDLISFYSLPSTIIGNPEYNDLRAAYAFYNVSTTQPLKNLMKDALIFAKQLDFDVFNALDLMDNSEFLKDLNFGIGDGNLQYYLYNWRCKEMAAKDVGIVML